MIFQFVFSKNIVWTKYYTKNIHQQTTTPGNIFSEHCIHIVYWRMFSITSPIRKWDGKIGPRKSDAIVREAVAILWESSKTGKALTYPQLNQGSWAFLSPPSLVFECRVFLVRWLNFWQDRSLPGEGFNCEPLPSGPPKISWEQGSLS